MYKSLPESLGANSPLWMVTQEHHLTNLISTLSELRARYTAQPLRTHSVVFARSELEQVRKNFARTIRRGESKLHKLSELLCHNYFASEPQLQSVVVGEVEKSHERFTLLQNITARDLYSQTDLDLGTRQIQRLKFQAEDGVWQKAVLVANIVEYLPKSENSWGVHKIISRIKAEQEIWNKVVDEIFDIDSLVRRDKKLRHLSRFVKDIFGVKMVLGNAKQVREMAKSCSKLRWKPTLLDSHGLPLRPEVRNLETVEVKNYLGADERKASGWEALKLVVQWWDTTFEIQIQDLATYHRERENLTRESHSGFKLRREALRDRIAEEIPLFGFYRDLVRWLVLNPNTAAPKLKGIRIIVEER